MTGRERTLFRILLGVGALWLAIRIGGFMSRTIDLVKRWEGKRLTAYQDVAGLWTIGYGHLIRPGEQYHPYGPVNTISEEEALALLDADLAKARGAVESRVKVPLTAGQRAALHSLVFNIGTSAFAKSTLLRLLNAGDYQSAADQFLVWNRAGGAVIPGLSNRRAAERQEFLS